MKLEVLISCMRQKDMSLAEQSHIQSDLLLINQCDRNYSEERKEGTNLIRMISTTERGLSRSRNMALKNATGDICLICDDDEILDENYQEKILNAFEQYQEADLLVFVVSCEKKEYRDYAFKINFFNSLKVASWQIAFRRQSVLTKSIRFDESVGSGVSAAGGEENIFLHDCLRKGLQIWFVPIHIGRVTQEVSQWAHNIFTPIFFVDRGRFTKKLWGGHVFALAYAFFYAVKKYPQYKDKTSFFTALFSMLKGILTH